MAELKICQRKKEMEEFISNFEGMPDRLLKYLEILIEEDKATPFCYQDAMSFRRLAIELTTFCNLNCVWCYRRDPNYKHILNKAMPLEMLEKIIKNTKGRFRMLHFGGLGEPLIYPKLARAIEMGKELSDQIKITTNGTLLTKEKIDDFIKKGLTHIEISIDAFDKEVDDKLKALRVEDPQVRSSDLDKIEMVKYVSGSKLDLQINSVVTNINYDSLKNIVDALKGCKRISRVHFVPLFTTKQSRDVGIQRISDEKFKSLLVSIEEGIRKNNLDWKLQPSSLGVEIDPVIEMKRCKNICFTCFEDPYISVEGKMLPCPRQKKFEKVDATVGFEKAWNHPKLVEFRKNMLQGNYPVLCGKLCYLKEKKEK